MENEILYMLIDTDRDDQEIFKIALMQITRKNKCLCFSHCLEADLYLRTPGSIIPTYIFVDTYNPVDHEEYCLADIKGWKKDFQTTIIIYSGFISVEVFQELKDAGINNLIIKTSSLYDLVYQLEEIIT